MSNEEIRPFRIDVPQADLDDLARRLDNVRWPDEAPGVGWSHGLPLDYARELARYWRTGYDWRAQEARLNTFPSSAPRSTGTTSTSCTSARPSRTRCPVILTHGRPGSIVEFLDVIGPLTDPVAHGGDARDAFHVVVPTIPGFGFSGPAVGWSAARVAPAWAELMRRLGYGRYTAHGGDFGAAISRELGLVDVGHVVALHLTQIFSASVTAETADLSEPHRTAVGRGRLPIRVRARRLRRGAEHAAADAVLRAHRLPRRPARLDRRHLQALDGLRERTRGRRRPRRDADQRDDLLAERDSGLVGALLRAGHRDLGRAAAPLRGADRRRDPAARHRVAETNHNIVRWTTYDRAGTSPRWRSPTWWWPTCASRSGRTAQPEPTASPPFRHGESAVPAR